MDARMKEVTSLVVPTRIVNRTLDVLRQFGRHGCEGLVLWVGTVRDRTATVEDVFVPDQHPIRGEEGVGYAVGAKALFEVNRLLSERNKRLLAQVHSHPSEAFHSAADDKYAIVTTEGGLSLVVPDFGHAPPDFSTWAVYRLTQGTWRELDSEAVHTFVQMSD